MLPVCIGNFSTSLIRFYANSCKIKGRIPNDFGNLSSLLDLDLSANSLARSIPTTIGNLRNLQRFDFSNNKLTGFIGDHICKLQHLGDIYLGQNQLSGSLPNCLGNITSLREIHLGSNKLSSNIPPSLGNLHDLVVLDLSSNNMVGSLGPEFGNLKVATLIDLSVNQFSNEIPREIGGLPTLVHLSLKHNKLQGCIPNSESNMVGLEFLDLSNNNISGIIPMSLEKLQNLKHFNVSVNKLYGEIPLRGPFKNLSSQFFNYNQALCGSSRFSIPPCPTSTKHRLNKKRLLVLFLLLGIILLFALITSVCVWIRYRIRKRAPQQADSLSAIIREKISYYELLQATDALSESNVISSGIKVFNLQVDEAFRSFDTECEVLRNVRHRNLVKVITSCSNLDFKDLVLDYMPNGKKLVIPQTNVNAQENEVNPTHGMRTHNRAHTLEPVPTLGVPPVPTSLPRAPRTNVNHPLTTQRDISNAEFSMRAQMRKFASALLDDLVLECKGAMLNWELDFASLTVDIQQVEEKKKKIAESKEKDKKEKRARSTDRNPSQQQGGNWGKK
ncbi:receptor kinase-like protein Xa21 [Capsicum annuum]|uniref:receptor kinase-like protein Xa21 n=1 Tax=Capsicum annuum TaxID=4072 RepID=UPI001FB15DEE|nr:receptor kinase-like protein Xa21 [Capsicum annuum]